MKHTRSKKNGMKRHMRMLAILLVPVVALILGTAATELWADDDASSSITPMGTWAFTR
jgi:hypothetical protein